MENSDPGSWILSYDQRRRSLDPGGRPGTVKPESQGPIQGKNRLDLAIEVVRDASQLVTHEHTLDVNFRDFDFINKSNIQQQQEGKKGAEEMGREGEDTEAHFIKEGSGNSKVYEVDKRKKTKIVKESKQTRDR
jgi:hypothetical protein